MIGCPRCGKENQDHYKFCLGCGAELPRAAVKRDARDKEPAVVPAATAAPIGTPAKEPMASKELAPRPTLANEPATQVGGHKAEAGRFDRNMQFAATQQGELAVAAAARAASAGSKAAVPPVGSAAPVASGRQVSAGPPVHRCPACSNPVPADFKFCGTCGHRIAPAPAAAASAIAAAPATHQGAASPQPVGQQRGKLVLINPDGSEGSVFPLYDGATAVGRGSGRIFSSDAYLSPVHATFTFKGDTFTVRDEQSLNGVYLKLARDRPARLAHGDVFRIGQEILRFELIPPAEAVDGVEIMGSHNPGYLGRICLVIGRESIGHAHTIAPDGMSIGRERGDVVFPEDGYVSGLHCRIARDGSAIALTDVGSSNGTFLRVRGERRLANGELVLMGQQLFRLQS